MGLRKLYCRDDSDDILVVNDPIVMKTLSFDKNLTKYAR